MLLGNRQRSAAGGTGVDLWVRSPVSAPGSGMAAPQAESLLRRLTTGDHTALGEFYDLYAGLVNGLALRILRDRAEAEDVVQEVFVQVWRQAARFDPRRGSPEAWICTIGRTRALDRLRRRTSRREDASSAAPGAAALPRSDEALAVRKALEGLSPDQRRALELAYYEGFTQSEIAERLREPLGTIKTRIRTAMIRLREVLGGRAS
jgi:RNA polymerase sigma-70 factor (ECF subfamily)